MIYNNILEAIGRTPLIRLFRITDGLRARLYVKCEFFNPGGSVKDRIAVEMINSAEQKGLIKKNSTIIEATAGNTGIGLAMVCAIKGYKCIFVVPEKMSREKINILKAYGAEVIIVPNAPPESPENYNNYANRLAQEIPDSFRPSQFTNLDNPAAHYKTTGKEIFEDLNGKIDVLVAGIGTGGTISGTGQFLKERIPDLYIIAADPAGSVLSGDSPKSYKVEGIGEDFVPTTLNAQLINEFIRITDEESFITARRLAKEEGILAGGSSGTALAAALKYARRENKEENIVVILPDTGRNYISKFYSDDWMIENGFNTKRVSIDARTILIELGIRIPNLITLNTENSIMDAINIMNKYGISQLPVKKGNDIVGNISEESLLYALKNRNITGNTKIEDIMSQPLPQLDISSTIEEIQLALSTHHSAVIIKEDNKPISIITKSDLINFLLKRSERYEI